MNPTKTLVDRYYACWQRGDFEQLAPLLAEDFVFRGAMDRADSAGQFIELIKRNAPMFKAVQFKELRQVIEGERLVSLYDFCMGEKVVPMAEAFEVSGDRIRRIDLFFDPARFA